MKDVGKKTYNLLLVIFSIMLFINDFSKKNTKIIDEKIIVFENYITWNRININNFLTNVFLIQNVKTYFQDQKKLIEENKKLNHDLKILQEIALINQMFSQEKNKSIYNDFEFHPVQIKYNNKKFYGVIENENDTITQNDLVVNYCGVIGKISHVGNKMAIVMLANHPNFSIPITFENNKDNIGLYSFNKNKILEIKQQNILLENDILITSRYKNKIPEGIVVGKIIKKSDEQIIENKSCKDMSFGFVLKSKIK
jgi:cell shape-determining protein MreC